MVHPNVTFLGLGIMGGGMARRLLGAGIPLVVFNRNRAKAEALRFEGLHHWTRFHMINLLLVMLSLII